MNSIFNTKPFYNFTITDENDSLITDTTLRDILQLYSNDTVNLILDGSLVEGIIHSIEFYHNNNLTTSINGAKEGDFTSLSVYTCKNHSSMKAFLLDIIASPASSSSST